MMKKIFSVEIEKEDTQSRKLKKQLIQIPSVLESDFSIKARTKLQAHEAWLKRKNKNLLSKIRNVTVLIGILFSLLAAAESFGQDNQILTVSPEEGEPGNSYSVTLTLDSDTPAPPPVQVDVDSATIGSIAGTSVARSNQYTVIASFSIPAGESAGTKDVVVTFTTPQGTLTFSKSAGFTVTPGSDTPPSITSPPLSRTVLEGTETVFTVEASGTEPLFYQWQKDLVSLTGETNTSYTIDSTGEGDEGSYRCVVSNAFGFAVSSAARLTVLDDVVHTVSGYTIVDTGQETFYNNSSAISKPSPGNLFYGQDAQYAGNQPTYISSGDGLTVYDYHTGLTWTQTPDLNGDGDIDATDKKSQAEAAAHVSNLNTAAFGGYNDWRLPSIKEIYSLMDFRGTDPMSDDISSLVPFIDTSYFAFGYGDTSVGERTIDAQFATTSIYVDTVMSGQEAMFGLNLADGRIKGYPTSGKTYYVLYVRGNSEYGINDFENNEDGTVTDHATGLLWQQADSGSSMIWSNALAYAEGLELAGYKDWRLPNAKELQSLFDYTRSPGTSSSAAIHPVFYCTPITNEGGQVDYPWYFTGTTHGRQDGTGSSAVYLCFGRSTGYMSSQWLDVHGAGAQRSDSKSYNTTGYTYVTDGWYFTISPQGDAARWYNYVRCVRGAKAYTSADTDEDGLTDAYEYNYSGSTTAMLPGDDGDGDGANNADEEAAGTIPTDGDSVLEIVEAVTVPGGAKLAWSSEPGKTYSLQFSTNLLSDSFSTTLASRISATSPLNIYTNNHAGTPCYFRVVVE